MGQVEVEQTQALGVQQLRVEQRVPEGGEESGSWPWLLYPCEGFCCKHEALTGVCEGLVSRPNWRFLERAGDGEMWCHSSFKAHF